MAPQANGVAADMRSPLEVMDRGQGLLGPIPESLRVIVACRSTDARLVPNEAGKPVTSEVRTQRGSHTTIDAIGRIGAENQRDRGMRPSAVGLVESTRE